MAIGTTALLATAAVATAAGGAYAANKASSAAKAQARSQASAVKDDAQASVFIAEEQTRQLEKEIAFQKEQAEKDRQVQLQAIEANKFLAQQGLALEEKAVAAAEKAAAEQAKLQKAAIEAQEEATRANESIAIANQNAAILGKPDLKQLAIPGLIAVYLYYKFMR